MSDQKLKLYVVSIMAFCPLQDVENENVKSIASHLPYLLTGTSMDALSVIVKPFVLNQWKIEDGWYGHSISFMQVSTELFEMVLTDYHRTENKITEEFQFYQLDDTLPPIFQPTENTKLIS